VAPGVFEPWRLGEGVTRSAAYLLTPEPVQFMGRVVRLSYSRQQSYKFARSSRPGNMRRNVNK